MSILEVISIKSALLACSSTMDTSAEMDKLLKKLDDQNNCTVSSGLAGLLALVKCLLMVPYPNVLKKPLKKEYDFVVVGSGSAGSTVASRLSENPNWSVLLLEAGGEEPTISRIPCLIKTIRLISKSHDWDYKTVPNAEFYNGKPISYSRAKMLGGCDAHNDMWYMKGHRRLFDDMTKMGIKGWSYEEVLPFYEKRAKAREVLDNGTEADMSVEKFPYADVNVDLIMKAYKELGFPEPDKNGDHYEGYKTTSKHGERISANRLYIEKIRCKRPNLHVKTGTMATKITIDPTTKTATAVKVLITEGGKNETAVIMAKKEVIVCGGVINSPKLLQHSGIGPENLLKQLGIEVIKDLKVGYNFLNHLNYLGIKLNLTTTSQIPHDCQTIRKDLQNYISNKSGPFTACGVFYPYLLTNSSRSTKDYPDLLFAFMASIEGLGLQDKHFCSCYYNTFTLGPMAAVTNARGSVFINSKNPTDDPHLNLGYSEADADILAEAMDLVHKIANSKTFKDANIIADNTPDPKCKDKKYASFDYWKCVIKGKLVVWMHGTSTCSMGPKNDPKAVVDYNCKVHGIKGLRVIDASILPLIPNTNINSVVLMMAERGVDFVKQDYA